MKLKFELVVSFIDSRINLTILIYYDKSSNVVIPMLSKQTEFTACWAFHFEYVVVHYCISVTKKDSGINKVRFEELYKDRMTVLDFYDNDQFPDDIAE